MGLSSQTLSLEGVLSSPQSPTHFIMFRFVALFALVAVAAAEPQWYAPVMDATHMKTASGDTVSVAAHKAQHHTLKAAEYAKKGYAFGYVKPAVYAAAPVQSVASYVAPATYTHATYGMPVYNTYAGVHHLGKREAEADSQYLYSNGVYNTGVYANGYNGYALPKVYSTVAAPVYSGYNGVYNGVYNTYAGYPYATGYTGYTGYTGLTGYTTPYTYGNIYNRYHFQGSGLKLPNNIFKKKNLAIF